MPSTFCVSPGSSWATRRVLRTAPKTPQPSSPLPMMLPLNPLRPQVPSHLRVRSQLTSYLLCLTCTPPTTLIPQLIRCHLSSSQAPHLPYGRVGSLGRNLRIVGLFSVRPPRCSTWYLSMRQARVRTRLPWWLLKELRAGWRGGGARADV